MQTNPWGTIRFTDKIALITGGASGIGRATANRLSAEGATLSSPTTTPKWRTEPSPKSKKQGVKPPTLRSTLRRMKASLPPRRLSLKVFRTSYPCQ